MLTPSFQKLLVILLCFLCTTAEGRTINAAAAPESSPLVPALYVFGDSIVENGNNNNFVTVAKGDYFPYGVDFPKGSTGRFSNGRTIADIFSDVLHLPFSPPFLGSSPLRKWTTGYNYASSACGILPETGFALGQCLNFDEQIKYFKDTIELRLKNIYTNQTDLSQHLSKSILLVVMGNNDYLNNYMNRVYLNEYKKMNPKEFANVLFSHLSRQLKNLYDLGARKLIFSEVAPVGCMPYACIETSNKQLACNETKNEIVAAFNEGLEQFLSGLSAKLPNFILVVAKNYNLVHEVVDNPTNFGFEESRHACCNATSKQMKCVRGLRPCKNRDKHCFWDGFHPSEAMSSFIIEKSLEENPIDILL